MLPLGKISSISRIFNYCNKPSPDLNITFDCVFGNNIFNTDSNDNLETEFTTYHNLNGEEDLNDIETNNTFINNDNKQFLKVANKPFTPNDIRKAYSVQNIDSLPNVRRPIITIISCFKNPYLTNDVNRFGQLFNLPKCNLEIFNLSNTFNYQWAIEMTLDVQWAYAMNPYAKIRVVSAKSSKFSDVIQAINFANSKGTDIMSMSFGMNDNGGLNSYNRYFSNTNIVYIASSGDNSIVSFPSSCTNVVAVGGTSLILDSNKNRTSETVWSFSGCGYSASFSKPFYQPLSSSRRITPDISCVADPNTACYVVLNNKLYSIGGTSLSCPIYAGIISSHFQQKQLNNKRPIYTSVLGRSNSIQPLLYSKTNWFYDVVQGKSGSYSATRGFDVASGLGVIDASKIAI